MIERIGILSDDLWAMRDEIAHLTGAVPVRLGFLLPARSACPSARCARFVQSIAKHRWPCA
jgi:hypothetical protein